MKEIKVGMKVRVISSVEKLKKLGLNSEIVKDIEFNRNRIYTVKKVKEGVLKLEEFKGMPSYWVGRMDVEVAEEDVRSDIMDNIKISLAEHAVALVGVNKDVEYLKREIKLKSHNPDQLDYLAGKLFDVENKRDALIDETFFMAKEDREIVEDKVVKIKDKVGFNITLFDEVSEMLEELRTIGAKRCASCGEYDEDLHPTFNVCMNCFSTGE